MPIEVQCECGHEITVSEAMAGRKGRCPACDEIIRIPSKDGRAARTGAHAAAPRDTGRAGFLSYALFSNLLSTLALLAMLAFAGIGVYTGVTAFKGPEAFHGPFGLFEDSRDAVETSPVLMGLAFIVGGLVVGGIAFIVFAACGQALRLLLSLERSLARISEDLTDRG